VVAQNQTRLSRRVPVMTLIVVGAALAIFIFPGIDSWLVYDRSAILKGQLWRLITGQWVHFSTSHLVYDTLAFGIAGWMIESSDCSHFGWLCGISPVAIGIGLLAFEPQLVICSGLSGMATGAVVFLALWGLGERGIWRWVCLLVLTAIIGKIAIETLTGHFIFLKLEDPSIALVPASHIIGGLTALVVYAWSKAQKSLHS
jgi:rhomboid family GlyGly-CTERM serine protease